MIILYVLSLVLGFVSGIFYTIWKINQNIKLSVKTWNIGIGIGVGILTSIVSWGITRIFSDNIKLIILFVVACLCMIFLIPKLVLSFVQLVTLKKYKLELK